MKKLYIGNLSSSTTQSDLSDLFEQFGPVVSCRLIKDKITQQSRGFAFVELENDKAADEAISQLDGSNFQSNKIKVNEARPMEDRGGSSSSWDRSNSRPSYSSNRYEKGNFAFKQSNNR